MKLAQCKGCGSQFDVSSMEAGSSFICGKCGKPVEVPTVLQPVVQPISSPQKGQQQMPATVVLTPDEMKKALKESRSADAAASKPAAAKAASTPKLPKAMQKRAQAKGGGTAQARAGGAQKAAAQPKSSGPKPIKARAAAARSGTASKPAAAKPAAAKPAARKASASAGAPAGSGGSRGGSSDGRSDRRGGREERAPAAKKKPNIGLFIGIGAVAVIGITVAALKMGGSDEPVVPGADPTAVVPAGTDAGTGTQATTAPAAGTGGSGGTVEAQVPKDEFDTFAALSADDQWGQALTKLDNAKGNATALEAAYKWFKNDKLAASAKASAAAEIAAVEALKIDTGLEWAKTALGKENGKEYLETLMSECVMAFQVPEETEKQVVAELEKLKADPWVDERGLRKLELLATKVRDRNEVITKDPRWAQIAQIESDLKSSVAAFSDLTFIRKYEAPYVIFQEQKLERLENGEPDPDKAHVNAQRLKKAQELAQREMDCFQELNRQFLRIFGDRFDLHDKFEKHQRLLVCVMLWDREKFDAWNKEFGSGVGFSVRAYYSPARQVIVHYVGDESMRAQDEVRCEKDPASGAYRVQKGSDQVTFHEGTHQLMHEYGAIVKGHPNKWGEFVIGNMGRTMWFEEGLAEFMGGAEVDSDGVRNLKEAKWTHNRVLLERTRLIWGGGTGGLRELAKKWTIADLLPPNSNEAMKKRSEEIAGAENGGVMIGVFYARGWGLTHFLYWYDGGKYRDKLMDYLEGYFRGSIGPEKFASIFGKKDAKDWGDIEKEFNWYWDEMVGRPVGHKINKANGTVLGWWYPETDPPEGPMKDPDDGGFSLDDDDEDE